MKESDQVVIDERFGPAAKDFEFTVPADYVHDTHLDTFAEKTKKLSTTHYFNDNLTSKNFAKATNKLEPGKTYRVRIFPVLQRVTSEDCLTFLKKQGAIFVGTQGLTLVQEIKPDEFPIGKWTVSFDEKDALWKDAHGYRRVPGVVRISDGDWKFDLCSFGLVWCDGDCLLCVCDLES